MGAAEGFSVDEEIRRAARAHALGVGEVAVDRGFDGGGGAVLIKLVHVQAEFFGDGFVGLVSQELLPFPEFIVILPELPLNMRGLGGVGGGAGLGVEAEREILGHPTDAGAVLAPELLERGLHAAAEGALVIEELYDGDGGVFRALGGIVILDDRGGLRGLLLLLVAGDAREGFVAVGFEILADDGFDIGPCEWGGGGSEGKEGEKGEGGEEVLFHARHHASGEVPMQGEGRANVLEKRGGLCVE